MTQGTGEVMTRRCPRCGGLMKKPPGSSLFWHSDNNHPRCEITNIVDTADATPVSLKMAEELSPEKGRHKQKK
jgi:hypothetical protein